MVKKIYVAQISDYPLIHKNYPKAKYMLFNGMKFKTKKDIIDWVKKQQDYKRRVHKPIIKLIIVKS